MSLSHHGDKSFTAAWEKSFLCEGWRQMTSYFKAVPLTTTRTVLWNTCIISTIIKIRESAIKSYIDCRKMNWAGPVSGSERSISMSVLNFTVRLWSTVFKHVGLFFEAVLLFTFTSFLNDGIERLLMPADIHTRSSFRRNHLPSTQQQYACLSLPCLWRLIYRWQELYFRCHPSRSRSTETSGLLSQVISYQIWQWRSMTFSFLMKRLTS